MSQWTTECKQLQKVSLRCIEQNFGEVHNCRAQIDAYKACIKKEMKDKVEARRAAGDGW